MHECNCYGETLTLSRNGVSRLGINGLCMFRDSTQFHMVLTIQKSGIRTQNLSQHSNAWTTHFDSIQINLFSSCLKEIPSNIQSSSNASKFSHFPCTSFVASEPITSVAPKMTSGDDLKRFKVAERGQVGLLCIGMSSPPPIFRWDLLLFLFFPSSANIPHAIKTIRRGFFRSRNKNKRKISSNANKSRNKFLQKNNRFVRKTNWSKVVLLNLENGKKLVRKHHRFILCRHSGGLWLRSIEFLSLRIYQKWETN